MAPSPPVVEARGLTKRYGDLVAVDAVDFAVHAGECVGFLGPNGAGKTTTVRMISCATPLTGGSVRVLGLDVADHPRQVKAALGVCPQEDNLDPDFSVERNLLVYARYYGIPRSVAKARADVLLETLQLSEKRTARVDELSGGMKRRLVLGRALLNEPRLLLLDEPTTGLDPQARHLLWRRVQDLKAAGTTILLTTHYMEEASHLCDRVILMDGGRILLDGAPETLVAEQVGAEVLEVWNHAPEVGEWLAGQAATTEVHDGRVYVHLPRGSEVGRALGQAFPHQEHLLRQATLEDVFLRCAGRALKE